MGVLEVGQQTLVAVAQALGQEARILVFDRPTAALSAREAERLFQLVEELRSRGLGIVWISHLRLEEVFRTGRQGGGPSGWAMGSHPVSFRAKTRNLGGANGGKAGGGSMGPLLLDNRPTPPPRG